MSTRGAHRNDGDDDTEDDDDDIEDRETPNHQPFAAALPLAFANTTRDALDTDRVVDAQSITRDACAIADVVARSTPRARRDTVDRINVMVRVAMASHPCAPRVYLAPRRSPRAWRSIDRRAGASRARPRAR